MTRTQFTYAATGVCGVVGMLYLLVVSGLFNTDIAIALDKFCQLGFTTAAGYFFFIRARAEHGAVRRWRLWMSAAMGILAFALLCLLWNRLIDGNPIPGSIMMDASFAAVPVVILGAVLTLTRRNSTHPAARPNTLVITLDFLIVVGSLVMLTWVSTLESVVRTLANSVAGLGAVAHPFAYAVTLVALLVLSWNHRVVRQLSLFFIAIAGFAQSLSAWGFAYLLSKNVSEMPAIVDLGFMLCPALFFLAAIAPQGIVRPYRAKGRLGTVRLLYLLAPYIPFVATELFILVGTATDVRLGPFEIYLALIVVFLVIVRQLRTLIDNARLVDELRDSRELLRHQAHHDSLTGLANRKLFYDQLNYAADNRKPLVVLFIDIDGFKEINDNFGHAEGDTLLKIVAQRLLSSVRKQDTVSRLGGDEFGIVATDYMGSPREIGERILESLNKPCHTGQHEHHIRASIGISYRTHLDNAREAYELLGSADAAMYKAKRTGKGIVIINEAPIVAPAKVS